MLSAALTKVDYHSQLPVATSTDFCSSASPKPSVQLTVKLVVSAFCLMPGTPAFAALQAHHTAEARGSPSTLPNLPDVAASPQASLPHQHLWMGPWNVEWNM
jgi:hypothetical protein